MNVGLQFKLWLGRRTFRSTRIDIYQAILESITQRAGTGPVPLLALLRKWEVRDRARGDDRHLVYGHIARRLSAGYVTFADAIKPFVDDEEYLVLASAEQGQGGLEKALQLVISSADANATVKSEFRSAMSDPAMSALSLLGLSLIMGHAVWPVFLASVPRPLWSSLALACIDTQIWLAQNWQWLLLPAVLLIWAYFWTLPRWSGRSRAWFDRLPPWSIYRSRQAASLLGVISSLLMSGKTVREAFETMRKASSPYMAWRIGQMLRRYDMAGASSLDCVKTGFFSQALVDRINDAGENRDFGQTLAYVGGEALRRVVKEAVVYTKGVGRSLTLVFGLVFILLVYVTFVSTQEATDNLTRGNNASQKGG